MIESLLEEAQAPNAILTGGPSTCFEGKARIWRAARLDAVVKLLNGNRYEHFAPTSETVFVEGRRLQIFVWSGYTKVAE